MAVAVKGASFDREEGPEAATVPKCGMEGKPKSYDMKNSGVETWKKCRDACNADSKCEYFTWEVSRGYFSTSKASLSLKTSIEI